MSVGGKEACEQAMPGSDSEKVAIIAKPWRVDQLFEHSELTYVGLSSPTFFAIRKQLKPVDPARKVQS
jgi:hypothetical protein